VTAVPRLVGMVHLAPLPGSPRYGGSMDAVVAAAVEDATALARAGFPALCVENFGDVPFYADRVPPETVAAMTVAVSEVRRATGLPIGVNVLRNDALSALGIAAAVGAAFIRVNVLTGVMYTDQGPIVGRAAEIARARAAFAPGVEVWADVMVKHATPPSGLDATVQARDTVERGLADAVIVSGSGTGEPVDLDLGRTVRRAVPETPIVIGSGATPENLPSLCEFADAVIVGSSLKVGGDARNPVDPGRAEAFVTAAGRAGLLR
jgi:membrane complex biogenesis BtpA family protein